MWLEMHDAISSPWCSSVAPDQSAVTKDWRSSVCLLGLCFFLQEDELRVEIGDMQINVIGDFYI